jgi:hypothetical protein
VQLLPPALPTQLSDVAGGATTTLCTLVLLFAFVSVTVNLAVKVVNVVAAYEWVTGLAVPAAVLSPKSQLRDWNALPAS